MENSLENIKNIINSFSELCPEKILELEKFLDKHKETFKEIDKVEEILRLLEIYEEEVEAREAEEYYIKYFNNLI